MKNPQDDNQLSLFEDPYRQAIRKLAVELLRAGPKLERMLETKQQILLGRAGYANPEYIKQIRAHRKVLYPIIGAVVAKATTDWHLLDQDRRRIMKA